MWSSRVGMHTKRSASTNWYERNELQKYVWNILIGLYTKPFQTDFCDTSSLCRNIVTNVICSSVPSNQKSIPPHSAKPKNKWTKCWSHSLVDLSKIILVLRANKKSKSSKTYRQVLTLHVLYLSTSRRSLSCHMSSCSFGVPNGLRLLGHFFL